MSDQPQTWHYGLIARWWAEFNEADPEELAFYREAIERNGQPALDLACGTGRLLLPLLRAGLDVDGCDISQDMLAHLLDTAEREGLRPQLYRQSMHEINLPRQYRTIFICDSFGIGGTRGQDLETLRRCYRLLAPGGALVFSHYPPYGNADDWPYWLPERRNELPRTWPESDLRKRAADGDEIAISTRLYALDPLRQRHTRQVRARLWRGERLIQEEEGFLQENLYFVPELKLMLQAAGFADVEVRTGYANQPAPPDATALVSIARKPPASSR